jgi:hypothetical protein
VETGPLFPLGRAQAALTIRFSARQHHPHQWGNAALVIHWKFFRSLALSEIGRVTRLPRSGQNLGPFNSLLAISLALWTSLPPSLSLWPHYLCSGTHLCLCVRAVPQMHAGCDWFIREKCRYLLQTCRKFTCRCRLLH